jgi:hypothetical protein
MAKQPTVGVVMDRLVTDELFRSRLMAGSVETLADLHPRGFEFALNDVELFRQTNTLLRQILEKLTSPAMAALTAR